MTTPTSITKAQAQALANELAEMRPGDWKQAQLLRLFWDNRDKHPFPHLALAAVRVADNPAIKSPDVIFMPGPHWDMPEIKTPKPRPEACAEHVGQDAHNCICCAADSKAEQPPTYAALTAESEN